MRSVASPTVRFSRALVLLGCLALAYGSYLAGTPDKTPEAKAPSTPETPITATAQANEMILRQPGFFVPNLGQWDHPARFVHRSGPMTLFLQDRGWIVDLVERPLKSKAEPRAVHEAIPVHRDADQKIRDVDQKIRGVALKMTFEGDGHRPEILGEKTLAGHHNFFLGNDESRWRTDVPLYGSVRYQNLYPGISLRLREMNGVPEYDLLLQPGANLSRVIVHVEGAKELSIADDGSLVVETALGPLTQTVPKTWEVDRDGRQHEVACNFTMLGGERFGFEAPGWNGSTSLTIDPALIWSTFLGGSVDDGASAVSVDASGVVTLAGHTQSRNFPTTTGAYAPTLSGSWDTFVSRLDPSKVGTKQLVYSTFLGGTGQEWLCPHALYVGATGVVTVAGSTKCCNFPTTKGAYDTTYNGGKWDAFVSCLDPSLTGSAQLVYSTYLGGSLGDGASAVSVHANGVVTVVGNTGSFNFPTTSGAYDTKFNGGGTFYGDVFVSRLDPSLTGSAQLVYSTFLGGTSTDVSWDRSVDANGVVTCVGTSNSTKFPTTKGAYDTTHNGSFDIFVSRLLLQPIGKAGLLYSTFLGGSGADSAVGVSVDAKGVVTMAGWSNNMGTGFPTTKGAYDTTYNGGTHDGIVSRLDPSLTGSAQLVYSTYLGGAGHEYLDSLSVDASGVVTVEMNTGSINLPTTNNAYDRSFNGGQSDAAVYRLDPSKVGKGKPADQLVYATFLGGSSTDWPLGISVDRIGVVTVVGNTGSFNFPTTNGTYDRTYNGTGSQGPWIGDVFISRLSMGLAFYADRYELSLKQAGTQKLNLDAGKQHAGKSYAIFGSVTGTSPGITLHGINIPLNPDLYTNLTISSAVAPVFGKFRGTLDNKGEATASFNVPSGLPSLSGFTLHHAYIVFGNGGTFDMASNAVPLRLR